MDEVENHKVSTVLSRQNPLSFLQFRKHLVACLKFLVTCNYFHSFSLFSCQICWSCLWYVTTQRGCVQIYTHLSSQCYCCVCWVRISAPIISMSSYQVLDLLLLFILHCTNANQSRRGAERVLKLKVRTGLIQEALLQKTFRDYFQVGQSANTQASLQGNITTVQQFYSLIIVFTGHARVLLLHHGSCSEFAALLWPLRGALWWAHVPPFFHCIWLVLPAGGVVTHCKHVFSFSFVSQSLIGVVLYLPWRHFCPDFDDSQFQVMFYILIIV